MTSRDLLDNAGELQPTSAANSFAALTSRDIFNNHYNSADVLLSVYRLLESDDGPQTSHQLLTQLRPVLTSQADEELILLFNQMFIGIVRDAAHLKPKFFRPDTMTLLLRQSVVAACSALDVFVPHLLHAYLPGVVRIRQRHFLPSQGEVKSMFNDFRLKLEDIWPIAEETDLDERWNKIAVRVLDHITDKTLSNETGITVALALLGVDEPWKQIAARVGEPEKPLREKLRRMVSRRNDIVHRADRSRTDTNGPVQPIDFVWTQNHVGTVRTIALACYDLARTSSEQLQSGA